MESPRNAATNGEWRRVCRIDLSLSFYVVGGVTSNFRGSKKKKGRRGSLSFFSNDELKSITINHFTVTQKIEQNLSKVHNGCGMTLNWPKELQLKAYFYVASK